MQEFGFEKLIVWKESKNLCLLIYDLTNTFPSKEQFGITLQIRKAAFSVPNNIAEGVSRHSNKDKIRFLEIAYGSLMEVINCLIISYELKYLIEDNYLSLRKKISSISYLLTKLKNSFE